MRQNKTLGSKLWRLTLAGAVITGLVGLAFTLPAQVRGVKVVTTIEQVTTVPQNPLVTMQTVELEPGANSAPHRHSGPVFGYVLEGK